MENIDALLSRDKPSIAVDFKRREPRMDQGIMCTLGYILMRRALEILTKQDDKKSGTLLVAIFFNICMYVASQSTGKEKEKVKEFSVFLVVKQLKLKKF